MRDLDELRREIDTIDSQLLTLFAIRFAVVHEVGKYKKKNILPIQDKKREQLLVEGLSEKARTLNISRIFIQKVWNAVFQEAYNVET